MKRLQYVTLLEMLIAMSLTSVILMALMFFYQQVVVIGADIDQSRTEEFHMRFVEKRLDDIFTNIVSTKNKKDFVFFSIGDEGIAMPGSQSLIFTFDNGNCLDKRFSNIVVGRLILDPYGNLFLVIWPLPEPQGISNASWPVKKEILLSGVESLKFEFFVPPTYDKKGMPKDAPEPEPKGGWRQQPWLQEFLQLPVMVKVIVSMPKGKESSLYVFPLLESRAHVIYD